MGFPKLVPNGFDPHPVEAPPYEDHRSKEEHHSKVGPDGVRETFSELDGQETEEGGELDDGVHGD